MKREIELTIPTKVEDIKVDSYMKYFIMIQNMKENAELNTFVRINIVSIFCNVPTRFVRDTMNYEDVIDISDDILKVLGELDQQVVSTTPRPVVELYGTEFGFIPEFSKMSAGEFADLSGYVKDMNNLHKLVSVVYRPIKRKVFNKALDIEQYEITKYEGTDTYSHLMRNFPAKDALKAYFFLSSSYLILTNYSQSYSSN